MADSGLSKFCAFLINLVLAENGFAYNAISVQISQTLCLIVKSQRSVKHIWFLPTHKAKAKKPKELAPPNRT
jgi:hypothetical protein